MIFKFLKEKNRFDDYIAPSILGFIIGLIGTFLGIVLLNVSPIFPTVILVFIALCLLGMSDCSFKLSEFLSLGFTALLVSSISYISFPPLIISAVALIILTEILFLLDRSKPTEEEAKNILNYTTHKKIEALIESVLIFVGLNVIYTLTTKVDYKPYIPVSIDAAKIIGITLVAMASFYVYIWINSKKYKR